MSFAFLLTSDQNGDLNCSLILSYGVLVHSKTNEYMSVKIIFKCEYFFLNSIWTWCTQCSVWLELEAEELLVYRANLQHLAGGQCHWSDSGSVSPPVRLSKFALCSCLASTSNHTLLLATFQIPIVYWECKFSEIIWEPKNLEIEHQIIKWDGKLDANSMRIAHHRHISLLLCGPTNTLHMQPISN